MTWYAISFIVFYVLNVIFSIGLIGHEKSNQYWTKAEAFGTIIISALAIWMIIALSS